MKPDHRTKNVTDELKQERDQPVSDPMDDLRERAQNGESILIPCPVCDEEVEGPLTIDGDGDVRWDCPDCGPCNLSWYR